MINDKILIDYENYLYEEEKSKNTILKYMRDVRCFDLWRRGREVTKSLLIEYKNFLCGSYAPRSVNSVLSSLNAFLVYTNRGDLKLKTLKIQRRVFADNSKELTKEEYGRLLTAARERGDDRLYYLIQTIGSTGIRVSELEYFTVSAVSTGIVSISCKGKLRQILLPDKLRHMLLGYVKANKIKSGPVFVSKNGRPLNRVNIWCMLKNLCTLANVSCTKVFPHNLRHLFARTFYSLHKDIVRLADVLGHSNINTTRIYTAESGESFARQMCRLGLLSEVT